jgi:site-specific DNA recombinase
MNKPAAIYARVSTDDQAERGYSLPSQIEACMKFANQKGFDLSAVYQDDISGAKPIGARPNGYELQRAIDARQIKVVIVYCVDRLSRDIVDLLTTVREWLRAGIEIYTLDVGQVTSELDIVLVIKGWQGSDEREKIRERTTRGRIAKAKAGKVTGQGAPPYGYTYSNGELFIDEPRAQIVHMIFDWYINGDEEGNMMSLYKIAERLTEMGIPTPSNTRGLYRSQEQDPGWRGEVIRQILVSETYYGIWRYGKHIGKSGRGGKRQLDEQITVNVPAIISQEAWQLAQERRAYNSRIARRKMKGEYLLRGLIFCGCGRGMAGGGRTRQHPRYLYRCPRRYASGVAAGSELCIEPLVKGRLIEEVTWNYIIGLVKDARKFEEKLREAQADEAAAMKPKQNELQHVIALLTETEREADEIARAARKVKGLVGERLERQAEEVNRRYHALTRRKGELEQSLTAELTDNAINNLLQFREAVALGLENPTFEDRRRWLEILQTRVTVTHGIAVITCRLGGKPLQYNLFESGTSVSLQLKKHEVIPAFTFTSEPMDLAAMLFSPADKVISIA